MRKTHIKSVIQLKHKMLGTFEAFLPNILISETSSAPFRLINMIKKNHGKDKDEAMLCQNDEFDECHVLKVQASFSQVLCLSEKLKN